MIDTIANQLSQHQKQVNDLMTNLQIEEKRARLRTLQAQAESPTFWDNPAEAQKHMQEIARLNDQIEPWEQLYRRINDALELSQLGDDMEAELAAELDDITREVERMSVLAMLSGEYDDADVIMTIHAGAGGADAQDWAEMLERMYLRWMEQNGYKAEILERSEGEEAGIKTVMIAVKGQHAYGYLKSEIGVHRLVRISPFNANGKRQTSFAKVELWPDVQDEIDIEINEKDLKIDTYRSSGAGGQNVQKNETAIRITHLPTGIVVQCQNQRSQLQNRERAMQVLKARLFEIERQKQKADLAALKGENIDADFGNAIRSYVLHPYQLVKDTRTGYEVGNAAAVLDGRITDFMESYLRARITSTSS
ncbi:peptide chain release factor 2 [Aggregatilineales bacterium SYSU G02658]